MMEKCLLYKMVRYGEPGVPSLSKERFTHAYSSKYGKVRIYKIRKVSLKSKQWVADPANRVCDAPGSWYCTGQYPPALKSFIDSRHNFKQAMREGMRLCILTRCECMSGCQGHPHNYSCGSRSRRCLCN